MRQHGIQPNGAPGRPPTARQRASASPTKKGKGKVTVEAEAKGEPGDIKDLGVKKEDDARLQYDGASSPLKQSASAGPAMGLFPTGSAECESGSTEYAMAVDSLGRGHSTSHGMETLGPGQSGL